MEIKGIEVVAEERVGQGGHLLIRRMRLRLLRGDGTKTREGAWDFVERPMGLDAVVLLLWRSAAGGIEVLLRSGVRVPLQFGRAEAPDKLLFTELVAGILEAGEESEKAVRKRAADEALEEAGVRIDARAVAPLGPPLFPTPGMCAELFHFVSAEVLGPVFTAPQGDGSVFEEGARIEWVPLDEALARCARGEIQDMKTELALRRLREKLGSP